MMESEEVEVYEKLRCGGDPRVIYSCVWLNLESKSCC